MALKVVQWATGPVGRSALRHIILNPAYELAGLYVHGPEKVGVDAGQLVGLPPTGIRATNDRNSIYGLAADAVVYTPRMHMVLEDMDREVLALLESGKSVVTPSGYWYPPLYGPAYVERIEAACRQGQASLFGSGENPGFFLARMATLAASGCSEIRSISLAEFVDCEHYPSATMIFDVIGFGKRPAELQGTSLIAMMLDRCFQEELSLVAHHFGVSIDSFAKESKFATLEHDIEIDVGPIKAGTVVAQSHRWSAIRNGRPILTITNTWFVQRDVPGWDLEDHWVVTVDGRPCMHIDTHARTSLDRSANAKYADTDSGTMDAITAMSCVNAIPTVCAAAPGIVYPSVFAGFAAPSLWFT